MDEVPLAKIGTLMDFEVPQSHGCFAGSLPELESMTCLSRERTLMEDRLIELSEFFGKAPSEIEYLYRAYNIDKSLPHPPFDATSLASIINSYVNPQTLVSHLTRLMLRYTRLDMAFNVMSAIKVLMAGRDPKTIKVLDYGCGAADFGLAFGVCGCDVTLVDLQGGKIEFAEWRFRRRGLPVAVVPISEESEYPSFEGKDLVIAGDLLEHLRDPREGILAVYRGLRPGGYFWFPDFPYKEKSVGGDHLVSAANLRLESAQLVDKLFTRASKLKHLLQRQG